MHPAHSKTMKTKQRLGCSDMTAPNIQLKYAPFGRRTWQPVTSLAGASAAPERPRRLTWCYMASRFNVFDLLFTPAQNTFGSFR